MQYHSSEPLGTSFSRRDDRPPVQSAAVDRALWAAQGTLALVFGTLGMMKLVQDKRKLEWELFWTEDMPKPMVRTVGALETLGAVGVVAPTLVGVLPRATSLAALGLAMTMIGAMALHTKRRGWEMLLVNLALFDLAIFVAFGRGRLEER